MTMNQPSDPVTGEHVSNHYTLLGRVKETAKSLHVDGGRDPVTGAEVEQMVRDLLEPEPVAASSQIMRNAATMLTRLSGEVERLRKD